MTPEKREAAVRALHAIHHTGHPWSGCGDPDRVYIWLDRLDANPEAAAALCQYLMRAEPGKDPNDILGHFILSATPDTAVPDRRTCIRSMGHEGLHKGIDGSEWTWFEVTDHWSPSIERRLATPATDTAEGLDLPTLLSKIGTTYGMLVPPTGPYVLVRDLWAAFGASKSYDAIAGAVSPTTTAPVESRGTEE